MSDLSYQPDRYQLASSLEQRIKDLKYEFGKSYLELGKALKEIRDGKFYIELGYETIGDWLRSPEISLSANWAWNVIGIYELYVVENKLPEDTILAIDYTKLHDIAPMVRKNPEKIDDWLDKARSLRRIDLQRELRESHVYEKRNNYVPPAVENKQIILGDSLKELQKLESESIDAVITSPPNFDLKGESSDITAVDYGWIVDYHITWLSEVKRILNKSGVVLLLTNQDNVFTVGHALKDIGFYIIRDIIWTKPRVDKPISISNLIPAHETIIWARKGSSHLCNLVEVTRDVWDINEVNNYSHISDKPEFLLEKLIDMSTDLGQTILDPFAGCGNVLSVANRMKRQYIGIERDRDWYKICVERLQDAV